MAAPRILLVEDSPTQLKVASAFLAKQQYEVLTAMDGEEALQKALTEQPDLVVLDVVMPKMDGFQVCRKMKASPLMKQIPVIMLTSKNQKADEFWGKKQGADAYLTKPLDEAKLLEAIRTCLSLE